LVISITWLSFIASVGFAEIAGDAVGGAVGEAVLASVLVVADLGDFGFFIADLVELAFGVVEALLLGQVRVDDFFQAVAGIKAAFGEFVVGVVDVGAVTGAIIGEAEALA